ncbi:MAG: cupin domain-containing protein [Spirochaetes bacterium]|nr:MAG: cupin domain-containing protein [Spirochaetota bacterium]
MEVIRPEDIIEKLNLIPLENEGGFFKQTWASDLTYIRSGAFISSSERNPLGTAIYFLLVNSPEGFSALHTLPYPEIYHFYLGDSIKLSLFHKNGEVEQIIMGQDVLNGEHLQFTVPGDVIQGSRIVGGGKFALIGTTMTPGFIFDDLKTKSQEEMIIMYPEYKKLIMSLTRR